ncbi:VOC family protein [Pusillimonas noertemannii]|uniref:VOC family protein n=1 Tax=Pusillimonas noertemannii TaxID=305977 RepID=UPI0002D4BC4D
MTQASTLTFSGVHHTARPTWKLQETVRFYRDQLGLQLVHAISARGWGPADHADFLHFFFDSGKGSTIAFFYYIGTQAPGYLEPRDDYRYRATHTAWQVDSREELMAWREKIEKAGIEIKYQIRHEVIESIYFTDPNGYSLELTWQARPFGKLDIDDARRTIEAAIELEAGSGDFSKIDAVWLRKGERLLAEIGEK